jgi:hypothetical protein
MNCTGVLARTIHFKTVKKYKLKDGLHETEIKAVPSYCVGRRSDLVLAG